MDVRTFDVRTVATGLFALLSMIVLAAGYGISQSEAASEPMTLEPFLTVVHGSSAADEFEPAVYRGTAGQVELSSLVAATLAASPAARIETALGSDDDAGYVIVANDPEKYFFVTGGYYCGSGGMVLDVTPAELETRLTEVVDCAEAFPVSSIFRVERDQMNENFVLLDRKEWDDAGNEVARIENWIVAND